LVPPVAPGVLRGKRAWNWEVVSGRGDGAPGADYAGRGAGPGREIGHGFSEDEAAARATLHRRASAVRLPAQLHDRARQRLAFNELHRVQMNATFASDGVHRHDVGMVQQGRPGFGLAALQLTRRASLEGEF
jgi:hypothetical protein